MPITSRAGVSIGFDPAGQCSFNVIRMDSCEAKRKLQFFVKT